MALANVSQRDIMVMLKGDTVTVRVLDTDLLQNGWVGGQFFAWAGTYIVDGKPELTVRRSNGIQRGPYALWGSNEGEDTLISYTDQFKTHKYAQCMFGNTMFMARHFESHSYNARTGLNAMVDFYGVSHAILNPTAFALQYKVGNPVYVSERGLLTAEKLFDESEAVGYIFQEPSAENSFFLGVGVTT